MHALLLALVLLGPLLDSVCRAAQQLAISSSSRHKVQQWSG